LCAQYLNRLSAYCTLFLCKKNPNLSATRKRELSALQCLSSMTFTYIAYRGNNNALTDRDGHSGELHEMSVSFSLHSATRPQQRWRAKSNLRIVMHDYRVAQKNGAIHISLQIFWKLHDRIPWKFIGELLQYYMLNTVVNFSFKNFIALWSHLAKTQLLCDAQIYLYSVKVVVFSLGGATAWWNF